MEIEVPEGYTIIEIDGKPIEYENHILLVRDEDEQQIWMPFQTNQKIEHEHDVTEKEREPDVTEKEHELDVTEKEHEPDMTEKEHEPDMTALPEKRKDWSKEDTYLFISLLEKYKHKLEDPKHKKKSIFENISKEMAMISKCKYTPSSLQCENRYKSLIKKFREIRDHNNITGEARQDWLFYEKMVDFFGDRPNANPVAGCSSLELTKEQTLRKTLTEKLKRPLENTTNTEKPRKLVKKTKVRSEILKVLESVESKIQEREERKMKMLQQQHEDLQALMSRMLDIMERKN